MRFLILLLPLLITLVSSSVIGIDLGSEFFKISLIRPGKKLIIVENEHSKRSTNTMLAFTEQGRVFGENAYKEQSKKPQNSIAYSHLLLGIPFNDEESKSYFLKTFQPIELIQDENRTSITFKLENQELSNEEAMTMILEFARKISEKFSEGSIKDCAITIPSYWTRSQRLYLIYAAQAAGLNVLSLIHENTAAAFYYAIDRLDNETDHHALFYNLGSSSLQVTIAKYSYTNQTASKKPKQIETVEILSHTSDKFLGGSLFDSILADYLAGEFEKHSVLKVKDSKKAMMKLFQQSQSVKKVLSASKSSPVIINNLIAGVDFKTTIARESFEALIEPYMERLITPVAKALENSGLSIEQIDSFELIGGVTRVPKVQEILKEKLQINLGAHLNGDEAMAHGAAIFAANISAVIQVKPLWLTDINMYNVWAKFYSTYDMDFYKESVIFKEGAKLNTVKKVGFNHSHDVRVEIFIDYGKGYNQILTYYVSGVDEVAKKAGEDPYIMFVFNLDYSGLPFLKRVQAQYEEEVEVEEKPVKKEKKETKDKAETEEKDKEKNENEEEKDNKKEEQKDSEENSNENSEENKNAEDSIENKENSEDSEEAPQETQTETTEDSKPKKTKIETRKIKLDSKEIEHELPTPLTQAQIRDLKSKLDSFKAKEEEAKKLAEVKNDLEAYIYYLQDKIEEESFTKVTTEEEREAYSKLVSETKEWIESDSYAEAKTTEIKSKKRIIEKNISDALEREKEAEIRDQMVEDAFDLLEKSYEKLMNINATKPWIPQEDIEVGITRYNDAKDWLKEKVEEQGALKPWEPLAFRTVDIEGKVNLVVKQIEKLKRMVKPKPKDTPDFANFKDFDWKKYKEERDKANKTEEAGKNEENSKNEEEGKSEEASKAEEETKTQKEENKEEVKLELGDNQEEIRKTDL